MFDLALRCCGAGILSLSALLVLLTTSDSATLPSFSINLWFLGTKKKNALHFWDFLPSTDTHSGGSGAGPCLDSPECVTELHDQRQWERDIRDKAQTNFEILMNEKHAYLETDEF